MNFSHVRHWWLLLPLLSLLGIAYWLNQQAQPELAQPDSRKRHDPDAIVENFSATRLNDQGTPRFVIMAKKMLHFPDDDSTTLQTPHLIMLSAKGPAMHVRAKQGIVSSKGDEVFLHDEVEVLREADTRHEKFTLQTEYLHIMPDKGLLNTDRAVTMVEAQNTIRATGLEIDNNARTLKLLSQVKGDHVPLK